MLLLGVLVVALHEVGETAPSTRVKHLLTILGIASHQLVIVMLLLFKLIVEGLELLTLIGVAKTIISIEHSVDILAERHFGTESIHQVGWGVLIRICTRDVLQADVVVLLLFVMLLSRKLIEVWSVLFLVSTSSIPHGISLKFVKTASDAFNLRWEFQSSTNHHFICGSLWSGRV